MAVLTDLRLRAMPCLQHFVHVVLNLGERVPRVCCTPCAALCNAGLLLVLKNDFRDRFVDLPKGSPKYGGMTFKDLLGDAVHEHLCLFDMSVHVRFYSFSFDGGKRVPLVPVNDMYDMNSDATHLCVCVCAQVSGQANKHAVITLRCFRAMATGPMRGRMGLHQTLRGPCSSTEFQRGLLPKKQFSYANTHLHHLQ